MEFKDIHKTLQPYCADNNKGVGYSNDVIELVAMTIHQVSQELPGYVPSLDIAEHDGQLLFDLAHNFLLYAEQARLSNAELIVEAVVTTLYNHYQHCTTDRNEDVDPLLYRAEVLNNYERARIERRSQVNVQLQRERREAQKNRNKKIKHETSDDVDLSDPGHGFNE